MHIRAVGERETVMAPDDFAESDDNCTMPPQQAQLFAVSAYISAIFAFSLCKRAFLPMQFILLARFSTFINECTMLNFKYFIGLLREKM